MKKTTLLTTLTLCAASVCFAQTKRDSVKLDTNEVKTLYRNAIIIQQQLHALHIDGILRDKLDSVYNQSAIIFEKGLKPKVGKKIGGKP